MGNSIPETTLISLAMLNNQINNNKDYIDYFQPFIISVIREIDKSGKQICVDEVRPLLESNIGLKVPDGIVRILLRRLFRKNLLTESYGLYSANRKKLEKCPDFDADRRETKRHIYALVADFISFHELENGIKISDEEALDYFIQFLSCFSIDSIRLSVGGTCFSVKSKKKNIILVGNYLLKINKQNPDKFNDFVIFLQGNMIANCITDSSLIDAPKSYKDVIFFIDTPVLIELYGLDGEIYQQAANEMFQFVKKLSGKFAIFTHTKNETEHLIEAMANQIDSPNASTNKIIREARRNNVTKADLLLKQVQLSSFLENNGIALVETPPYDKNFQIDELALEKLLDQEIHYYRPTAKHNDINSIRSIYTKRGKTTFSVLEKSKAILVTSNTKLAQVAYLFTKSVSNKSLFPSVITSLNLSNISWLKAPRGTLNLPRAELLSVAYASLMPTKDFLVKVSKEIEKLENNPTTEENHYHLLKSSHLINDSLMVITGGDENALTKETIYEAAERVTNEIKSEENEKYLTEKENHQNTQNDLAKEKSENDKFKEKLYWDCDANAKLVTLLIKIILSAIFLLSVVPTILDFSNILVLNNILKVFISITAGVSALALVIDSFLFKWYDKVYKKIREINIKKAEKKYSTRISIPNTFSSLDKEQPHDRTK